MRDTIILQLPICFEGLQSHCEWLLQNAEGEQDFGQGTLEQALDQLGGRRLVVLAPSEKVLLTKVKLAIRQSSKLAQAIPYALEESVAEDVDDLHFCLGQRGTDGSHAVAVVSRVQMQQWLAPFKEKGVNPELLIPDALALDADEENARLLIDEQRCVLHFGPSRGLALERDSLPLLAQLCELGDRRLQIFYPADHAPNDLPDAWQSAEQHELPKPIAAFSYINQADRINLLQGEFQPKHAGDAWRKALLVPAAMAATWVVLSTAVMAYSNAQLSKKRDQLFDQAQAEFSQAFPHITRIVDIQVQAEQELEKLRRGGEQGGFLSLFNQSAHALKQVQSLQLQSVQFREGALYLNLTGDDLQALELLRGEFKKITSLRLDVQSAQAGTEGVQIRLKVDAA